MNVDWRQVWRTVKAHLAGPVGSVLFHVLVILVLVKFAVSEGSKAGVEVEVQMLDTRADKLELEKEVPKPVEKIETPVEPVVNEERPDVATVNTIDIPSDQNEGTGVGNQDGVGIGSGEAALGQGFEVAMTKSPLVMKGLYANRTAGGRGGAIRRFGGSGRGEDAVLRALRWLKKHQDEDGSWAKTESTHGKDGIKSWAALALLCFLAHNETPSSPEFGQTVEKAMKYLVSQQDANGAFSKESYTHGICTYAICESFALTKIMALKDSMDKAVAFIINGQQPQGGYNYGYAKGNRWDMSVSGWQFQAMKAAKMAGCTNERLDEAMKQAVMFLKTQAYDANRGGFGYSGVPGTPGTSSSPSMTGAGALCMQLMGYPKSKEVLSAMVFLREFQFKWEQSAANPGGKAERGQNRAYAYYYITQAKFQKGGADWKEWNAMFSPALISSQFPDGHWEGGDYGQSVYTTVMCVLMLEVYYRYLPTYQQAAEVAAPADADKPKSGDDVVVDVH